MSSFGDFAPYVQIAQTLCFTGNDLLQITHKTSHLDLSPETFFSNIYLGIVSGVHNFIPALAYLPGLFFWLLDKCYGVW